LLGLRQELEGLHVVQPFGQFRGGDPGVGGRHGRHRLASRPLAEVVERHVPGHHRRDPGTEVASHRGQRVRGVHNGAVQDGRA
jgi:hypothetical protein